MSSFVVSAPGKVILSGEYSALWGKPAIAAAIGLRSYLLVTPRPKSDRRVTLRLTDTGFNCTWDLDTLPWGITKSSDSPASVIRALQRQLGDPNAAVLAFLYMYLSLASRTTTGATYTLRSQIPIGAGLGSSASFSVVVATAILIQAGFIIPRDNELCTEEDLRAIDQASYLGERCFHGAPSGVDHATSLRGGALYFQRDALSNFTQPTIDRIAEFPELPILVVDTCQMRSTASAVKSFQQWIGSHQRGAGCIIDYIHLTTELIRKTLVAAPKQQPDPVFIEQMGTLLEINHQLLQPLGASHPRLERVRTVLSHQRLGWTKLTGAGCGGCSLTLLSSQAHGVRLQEGIDQLISEGFEVHRTELGGAGLAILMPGPDFVPGVDKLWRKFEEIKVNDLHLEMERLWESKWRCWA